MVDLSLHHERQTNNTLEKLATMENIQLTSELNWLIKSSEVQQIYTDCKIIAFNGRLSQLMFSKVIGFFIANNTHSCSAYNHYTIKYGDGSLNLTTSQFKGNTKVEFSACLPL